MYQHVLLTQLCWLQLGLPCSIQHDNGAVAAVHDAGNMEGEKRQGARRIDERRIAHKQTHIHMGTHTTQHSAWHKVMQLGHEPFSITKTQVVKAELGDNVLWVSAGVKGCRAVLASVLEDDGCASRVVLQ